MSEYDATTGKLIKAKFIKRLYVPVGLAVSDKDNALFVTSVDTVGKYDATTGAAINASLITGLDSPVGIAVQGKTLLVGNGVITANGLTQPSEIAVKSANRHHAE